MKSKAKRRLHRISSKGAVSRRIFTQRLETKTIILNNFLNPAKILGFCNPGNSRNWALFINNLECERGGSTQGGCEIQRGLQHLCMLSIPGGFEVKNTQVYGLAWVKILSRALHLWWVLFFRDKKSQVKDVKICTCLALYCFDYLENIGFVYPAMSMIIIDHSLLY